MGSLRTLESWNPRILQSWRLPGCLARKLAGYTDYVAEDGSLFLTLILVLDAFLRTSSYLLRAYFVACFVCTSKSEGGQDYFASCFASRFASTSRLLRVCFVKNSSGFVLLRVSSLLLDDFNLEFFQGDILTRTNLIVKLGLPSRISSVVFVFDNGLQP